MAGVRRAIHDPADFEDPPLEARVEAAIDAIRVDLVTIENTLSRSFDRDRPHVRTKAGWDVVVDDLERAVKLLKTRGPEVLATRIAERGSNTTPL
ncbi:MAG: hypothetical protein EBZ50_03810 [Alphaproteobacteria bacterium]|nr:hypothetical protein [Alphaproteobacteria bacterium]